MKTKSKHSNKFNEMFTFFLKSYRSGILDFCGHNIKVTKDLKSTNGKDTFVLFDNGKFKGQDSIKTRHNNILLGVITGKKSWGLWLKEWSEGISEGNFSKEEIISQFIDKKIQIPEVFMKEFDNLIKKKTDLKLELWKEKMKSKLIKEKKMKLVYVYFKYEFIESLLIKGLGVYIVGGWVRDNFLMKENKDIDFLVTGISLEDLAKLLTSLGHEVDTVGASFGVIKLKKEDVDIAVPRREKKVGEGYTGFEVDTKDVTLEEDLFRRDFTINSMALSLDDGFTLIDPYNGKKDLDDKIIRMTNPQAFSEDPLRMLRAIQFASRFKFEIEPITLQLIKDNAHLIKEISGERIVIELDKIFSKGDHEVGFELLARTSLLFHIYTYFPGYKADRELLEDLPRLDLLEDIETKADFYFALFYNRDISFFSNVLKLDTDTINHIKWLHEISNGANKWLPPSEKRMMIFRIIEKDPTFLNTGMQYMTREMDEFRRGEFPMKLSELALRGSDLVLLGFNGKEIGDAQRLMLRSIFEGVTNDPESLKSILTKV